MRASLPFLIAALTAHAACAEFPALDATVPPAVANAPSPELVPLGPILARVNATDRGASQFESALSPRLANLRARAARLRGPVIPPAMRSRMLRGVR